MRLLAIVLLMVVLAGPVSAASFTEDFESFTLSGFFPETKPEQVWYAYAEGSDIGNVSDQSPIIEGTKSFRIVGPVAGTAADRFSQFTLSRPTTLSGTNFTVQGEPIANTTTGSEQVITIQSTSPVRKLVQFYLFCRDPAFPAGCELRVRFDASDTTGQTLINTTLNQTRFQITIEPNWINGTYTLFVNGVNDGIFPFLELPQNIGRIRFNQYRPDVPMNLTFDVWTINDALPGGAGAVEGDAATGLKNFASTINFTSTSSRFLLGFIVFFILLASVIVPLILVGLDNSIVPATSFFAVLCALWLIEIEFWPDWIGIAAIIAASAFIASIVRRFVMGMRDASTGASLVAGSLGYFVIATSLLAFSGYASSTIQLPISPAEQQDLAPDPDPNVDEQEQTFIGAVAECIFTGGVFTFGLVGDCSQDTVTTTWTRITDTAGTIFGWIRASLDFVFQLLTFQFPIPVLFNAMIVFPPAIALSTYGISVIRGSSD